MHVVPAERARAIGVVMKAVPARRSPSDSGISCATVRSHIRGFDTKLGVHSKIEAVAAARDMKIID